METTYHNIDTWGGASGVAETGEAMVVWNGPNGETLRLKADDAAKLADHLCDVAGRLRRQHAEAAHEPRVTAVAPAGPVNVANAASESSRTVHAERRLIREVSAGLGGASA